MRAFPCEHVRTLAALINNTVMQRGSCRVDITISPQCHTNGYESALINATLKLCALNATYRARLKRTHGTRNPIVFNNAQNPVLQRSHVYVARAV